MLAPLLLLGWLLLGGGAAAPSGSLADRGPALASDPASPMALAPEAHRWAEQRVGRRGSPEARLRRLHRALTGSPGRGIRERSGTTPTAMQAFRGRRANCVAYAHLVVGLARSLGVDVYFVQLRTARHRRLGAHRVLERHLAAAFGPPERPLLIDLAGIRRGRRAEARTLDDREALAVYLSNRGAEAWLAGEPEQALSWLRSAVAAAPQLPAARGNYAVVWRSLERTARDP